MEDLTIEPSRHDRGRFDVFRHGVYERSSVLAGRPKRSYVDTFDTADDAQRAFPAATILEHTTYDPGAGDLGPLPPSWFDPADASEHWNDDY